MALETMQNDYGLVDKVAIVTGAGGPQGLSHEEGISNGRAAAVLLARAGAKVCVVGRTAETIRNTVDIIKEEGGEAFAQVADVRNQDYCHGIVDATLQRYGRLDCLDNNVGLGVPGSVVDIDLDTWHAMFAANVDSIMLMCKFAIPAMIKSGHGGAIVNIGSLRSERPLNSFVYTVTKGALIPLTRSLAVDHGADGIRANCIILGPVYTPLVSHHMTPEARQNRIEASLMKREGTGWDTGYLVRFLLSRQSRFMTGQSIYLDGGASIIGPAR